MQIHGYFDWTIFPALLQERGKAASDDVGVMFTEMFIKHKARQSLCAVIVAIFVSMFICVVNGS
jgi:hypothetical protein